MSAMKTKLRAVSFLLLFLTLLASSVNILCQATLEWSTAYSINVHIDGSSSWIIERRTLLTEYDTSNFFRYSSIEHLQEFSNNISALVNKVWLKTGREMRTENFKITATTSQTETGSYGTVKYQFDWLEFAEVENTRINVGDVFVEGLFLFGDGVLVIGHPPEYDMADVSPRPDIESDQALTWNTLENFGLGEPRVTFKKRDSSPMRSLQEYAPVIIVAIALAGISFTSLWFFKIKRRKKMYVAGPAPLVPLGIESEEEQVIRLLRAAGEPLYQSTITKHFGFSRSKTCKLLSTMENKGIIERQRKGREKVVTLIRENEGSKEVRKKQK